MSDLTIKAGDYRIHFETNQSYDASNSSIKDLLGIDFEDKGLAETIDSVTKNQCEMEAVQDAIGRAIFLDGGLLETGTCDSKLMIEQIAYDSDRVMNMLCYYAFNTESFMERL